MPELPPDFGDLLIELLDADVRFLLVGGYAVAHYGHPADQSCTRARPINPSRSTPVGSVP
jgi:hypothetical protein